MGAQKVVVLNVRSPPTVRVSQGAWSSNKHDPKYPQWNWKSTLGYPITPPYVSLVKIYLDSVGSPITPPYLSLARAPLRVGQALDLASEIRVVVTCGIMRSPKATLAGTTRPASTLAGAAVPTNDSSSSWPRGVEAPDHDGVLRVHPVLSLAEDVRLLRLHHAVRHLLATLCGEAMQEYGLLLTCRGHQPLVDLERLEDLGACGRLRFLAP